MKICSKCSVEKNETEFWVRKNRRSGVNSQCKECCKIRRGDRNKDYVNKIHREWCAKNPEKVRESSLRYQRENKEKVNAKHREWYEKNRVKLIEKRKEKHKLNPDLHNEWAKQYTKKEEVKLRKRANALLNYHLKVGNIQKGKNCCFCNSEKKLESHHADYNKPLEVIWVCRRCHVALHKDLEERK